MDYKRLIRSRNLRLKILSMLNWVPDEGMIRFQYWVKTGRILNLKNPKRYTEKLQWYKLFYKDELLAECADKYRVRKYVESKGLSNIINELYFVYDDINDIDLKKLPNSFVLKKSSGAGGNEIVICKNKTDINFDFIKNKINSWVRNENNGGGREWIYYKTKPRIIAEKLIIAENDDLIDYKFFCFNGLPFCLYVINGRKLGQKINLGIFDMNFCQLPFYRSDENPMSIVPKKPNNFNDMIEIAKLLSEDFPHARVDLYNNNGKIIFGEMTFFDGSGYQTYNPDEFDYILGDKFKLPNI